MIDQDKMRALATKLHDEAELASYSTTNQYASLIRKAADAIDLLLAEVEAAAADKRDAERFRYMNSKFWISQFEIEQADAALAQRQGGAS